MSRSNTDARKSNDGSVPWTERLDWTTIGITSVLLVSVFAGASVIALTSTLTDQSIAQAQADGFEMQDATVTLAPDESVWFASTELTFEGDVHYSGFQNLAEADAQVYMSGPDGEMQEVSVSAVEPDMFGTDSYDPEEGTIGGLVIEAWNEPFAGTGWTEDHFDPEPGETVTHDLDVRIVIELYDDEADETVTVEAADSFTIAVEREDTPDADPTASIEGFVGSLSMAVRD